MKDINGLFDKIKIIQRRKIVDTRGWFLKIITGKEDNLPQYTGEIYTVYAESGLSRGGHYHKKASEWFTLLKGEARLYLSDIQNDEHLILNLDSNNPTTIFIPPYIAHQFEASRETAFLLLAYTDKLYDPEDTIQYQF